MRDSQAPYIAFPPPIQHNDPAIRAAEEFARGNHALSSPVESMARRAGLSPRTFERRFKRATGYRPLEYVQGLRVEQAKQLLAEFDQSIEDVAWAVGYREPAAFRRVFKRATTLSPGEYRRRFRTPRPVRSG